MHSSEPIYKKLLFLRRVVEPAQLSSGVFDLSTALLLETLAPDPAEADAGIWLAVGNTLTAFSGQGTTEARKGVIRIATKMATACALLGWGDSYFVFFQSVINLRCLVFKLFVFVSCHGWRRGRVCNC